jgi:hypothetical protein
VNTLQKLRLRRLISEIAADTIAAYNLSGGLSPAADTSSNSGSSSATPTEEVDDNLEELDEEDLLSFTQKDRKLDNKDYKKMWR